ncbi:MAG TPA: hypothetical protein VLF66_17340 [Thermoanaerobaculia bacterium]|nr:hypothetical protein [Thermoanaerobaculia bacterium]
MLSIVAAADEACEGAGLRAPPRLGSGHQTREDDHFVLRTVKMLHEKTGAGAASLCSDDIHPSRLVVLPKLHTPQFGLTARSFSHHLVLCPGGAVRSLWYNVQRLRDSRRRPGMNLLILPWPDRVVPSDFQARRAPDAERDFGLFSYSPDGSGEGPVERLVDLLEVAEREVGLIDGVVLPELSVTEAEYQALLSVVHEKGAFLVAGVRGEEGSSWEEEVGANSCTLSFPITPHEGLMISQGKHHRWRLDRRQIRQYGIGSRLDPTSFWWEDTRIVTRKLHFVGLDWWVTASVLICEDLARLEPVSEVVRAVGPNLVIALLMDGPQLESRWPARYATVLADDPGCSVLTVTSLGMAQLSRSESGDCGSRIVALWKDDKDGRNIPIELPVGSEGVVLCLARETKAEWTADHRIGPDRAYYPTLVGVHPVRCGDRMGYTAVD